MLCHIDSLAKGSFSGGLATFAERVERSSQFKSVLIGVNLVFNTCLIQITNYQNAA